MSRFDPTAHWKLQEGDRLITQNETEFWIRKKPIVFHPEWHMRNCTLTLLMPREEQTQKTDNMKPSSHTVVIRVITGWMKWMKLRWEDSVTRLSPHSRGMLISWLWCCDPWRGMCHLPCHLSEQEMLVALPRGLPSRSSTPDTGVGVQPRGSRWHLWWAAYVWPRTTWQEGHYHQDTPMFESTIATFYL